MGCSSPQLLSITHTHTFTPQQHTSINMSGNIGWDDEIVLRKRSDHAKVTRSSSDINAARRAGAVVSTERKVVTNAGHVGEDFRRIAKLAESDEIVAPKAVSMDVGKAIAKARIELKLNQKDLGVKVNEKQTVVSFLLFHYWWCSICYFCLGCRLALLSSPPFPLAPPSCLPFPTLYLLSMHVSSFASPLNCLFCTFLKPFVILFFILTHTLCYPSFFFFLSL